MVWSLGAARRRRRLVRDAARARASRWRQRIAWLAVIIYNVVGVTDIASTLIAIESGAGQEANPIMQLAMEHAGAGWVAAKLALQGVLSFMVLWYPHWIVLGFFVVATTGNAWVVYNNFAIAGLV